jgi:hypothetical protein
MESDTATVVATLISDAKTKPGPMYITLAKPVQILGGTGVF